MDVWKKNDYTDDEFKQLLEVEKSRFVQCESFLEQISPNKTKKNPKISDETIKRHMQACMDFYTANGTIKGENSPWVLSYVSDE